MAVLRAQITGGVLPPVARKDPKKHQGISEKQQIGSRGPGYLPRDARQTLDARKFGRTKPAGIWLPPAEIAKLSGTSPTQLFKS
jgi:hypothetical protein